jgi:hypothetical protein
MSAREGEEGKRAEEICFGIHFNRAFESSTIIKHGTPVLVIL